MKLEANFLDWTRSEFVERGRQRSTYLYLSSLQYILRCISNSLLPTLFSTTLAAQVFGTGHEKVEPVSQVLTFAMKQYNSTAPMCPDIFWLTQEAASWILWHSMTEDCGIDHIHIAGFAYVLPINPSP